MSESEEGKAGIPGLPDDGAPLTVTIGRQARTLLWNVHASRFDRLMRRQCAEFMGGEAPHAILLLPPSDDEAWLVEKALRDARVDGHAALLQAICALEDAADALDRAGSKPAGVRAARAALAEQAARLRAKHGGQA